MKMPGAGGRHGWIAVFAMMLCGLTGPALAQTRTVTGQAGLLAEWDLTATVTEKAGGQWSGPLVLKHVGFCSVDGPEEKTGELRLRVAEPTGDLAATLSIDGVVCTFTGRRAEGYGGTMTCPDRRDVPMMLSIQ